ncbi:site-specific integrase [Fundidesulfovibrio putealis]|uniref:site-specific integrase n=1 Tax=Fundidesulfovibrio putealis TaxID=270496 RepID=UPI000483CEE6|nr:site-specific integrase [Fundidesulfovibrio putealis]
MTTSQKRCLYQWEARIRKRGYPTTCKTFNTRVEAEAWAKDVETNMNKSLFVSAKEAEQYTLSECLDRYIKEYIPRLKHPKRETDRARFLQKRTLAHRIMATIRAKDIADLRREREAEGASGNTIRLDFALLSKLFNYARSDWGMESLQNPVALAAKPRPAKGRDRRLEDGEEERLLAVASPRFKPVILFALETAMRRKEIADLRWKCVNLGNRNVVLSETKNSETRTVPLSPRALAVLRELPRSIDQKSVFNFSEDQITTAMKLARKKAKLDDLRFHDLRHEATSRFFELTNLDVMEIKAVTGHKTLQMLARYTHLRTARLADRLAGMKRG